MSDDHDDLRLVRHGPVAELVLDRPEALNAVSVRLSRALTRATASLAVEPDVRAVVLSSAVDRAFCVGADLKERHRFTDEDWARHRPESRSAYRGVLDLPAPTIAAVHGYALGGGFELALCCDLIVADETAVFGLPEVTLGLVPGGGGTQLLARRIGPARAADLVLTGRRIDLAEADRLGIIDRTCAAGQDRDTALALSSRIAANAPGSVRLAKQALRQGANLPLPAALEVEDAAWHAAAFSVEHREGIAAFNQRRPPVWPARAADGPTATSGETGPAAPPPPRSGPR